MIKNIKKSFLTYFLVSVTFAGCNQASAHANMIRVAPIAFQAFATQKARTAMHIAKQNPWLTSTVAALTLGQVLVLRQIKKNIRYYELRAEHLKNTMGDNQDLGRQHYVAKAQHEALKKQYAEKMNLPAFVLAAGLTAAVANASIIGMFHAIHFVHIQSALLQVSNALPQYTITYTPTKTGSSLPVATFIGGSTHNIDKARQFAKAHSASWSDIKRQALKGTLVGTLFFNFGMLMNILDEQKKLIEQIQDKPESQND